MDTLFEACGEIREHFDDFLDGESSREIFRSLHYHLAHCAACATELDRRWMLKADLRSLPHRQTPPWLSLRVRVVASQELHRNLFGRLLVRLQNVLKPRLLPVTAGVCTAIICFGLFMNSAVVPITNIPDVPVSLTTPPRVRVLAAVDLNAGDQPVVVVTHIDADGRVIDYQLLSGQPSPDLMHRLDRMMYFSLFQPATLFGRPTNGQVVLSFRQITVRG
ncbi:MAG TPA: hypothetical protein VKM93_08615 [Terriglobia bacterium]|nr:hypothetical protein [Terriglobia bacterium]